MVDSSGEDEFASNFNDDATTPFRVTKVSATADRIKPNGRAVAGPSNKPGPSRPRKRRAPSVQDSAEEGADARAAREHVVETDEDTDVIEVAPPAKGKGKGKMAVARPVAKGRGRTKASAEKRQAVADVIEFDSAEDELAPQENGQTSRSAATAIEHQSGGKRHTEERKLLQRLERTGAQLEQVTSHRNALATQLEELFHLRNTEPEQILQQHTNQYEIRLKTQEEMIQELTSQLARVDSLTRTGKTSTLHFLTREAADEERRGIERKVQSLTDTIKEKDGVIARRDGKIHEQEEIIRTLRADLKAEIENTKVITSRGAHRDPPSSANRGRNPPVASRIDESKNGKVIRLYEDLTNFLVINIKYEERGEYGEEETVYNCIYTHSTSNKSLNFSLRLYRKFAESDESNPAQKELEEKVVYTPLELEKEPDQDFVDKLDFLASPFTFHGGQLHLFLKSVSDLMDSIFKNDDAEEGE